MGKNKKLVILLSAVLVLIVLSLIILWTKFGQKAQSYECTNFAMGTYVQQTVYGSKREAAATAAANSVGALENLISWRIDDSNISKLNQAAGSTWTTLNPKTIDLLEKSLDVAAKSGGAFDPTVLPLSSLWDFGGENQHVPTADEINQYLKYINYSDLRVDKQESSASLKLHYMAVDLEGIGKGAACDEAVAAYRSAGADYGIIAVGNSVGVYGTKADKSAWHIAVRTPGSNEEQSAPMGTIDVASGFVSTSDIYDKSFTKDGVLYHQLLNPKTGYPENNGLVSVTVTCDNGALSDALSTACFVLGKDKGMELLKQYNAGGIFIDKNNHVYITDNLKNSFKIADNRFTLAK